MLNAVAVTKLNQLIRVCKMMRNETIYSGLDIRGQTLLERTQRSLMQDLAFYGFQEHANGVIREHFPEAFEED